ncbi:DUF5703 domain-containing protein [Snuella lapsa]|uniref:DUF5703 domain-containing protein n=2 Tax=Snuella lapsa TaxID=870481 RepID=A0ABP6WUT6_9FLAO
MLLSGVVKGTAQDNSRLKVQLKKYNIKWTSQSQNSSESMPLGGGDIGCNVWVENGDLLFYISRTGTFDENNQFLKLGRVRVRMEPNIFKDPNWQFKQELKLYDGYVEIVAKKKIDSVQVALWIDVFNPVVNVEVNSSKKIKITAFYENWRSKDRLLPMNERSACFSYSGYEGDVITYSDSVMYHKNNVLWYHRNRSDKLLFDFCVEQQGLTEVKEELWNPQKNLTFGGALMGNGMAVGKTGKGQYVSSPFKCWSLQSEKARKQHHLQVVLHTAQTPSTEEWKEQLFSVKINETWKKTKQWWHRFWTRSHIFINVDKNDPSDSGWQVGRNYQLFRYMLGCNAYGDYPTKFNGGLFTYDPVFTKQGNTSLHGTPDYRSWGGGSHTAQNQRLVYWPMLKSGDFDMMPSQFDFYSRSLKNTELRTKVYWGHKGCSFTEHPETFGLPAAATWGFDSGPRTRPIETEPGTLYNPWVKLHYTNQLEFAYLILEYYKYSGKDISCYLPFVESALTFFFEHYKYRQRQRSGRFYDDNGKLVIYPSTACETFKEVKNPTDVSAALAAVISAIQRLPDSLMSGHKKQFWKTQARHIPEFNFELYKGDTILVAAKNLPKRINSDIPELYPVFPYGMYGVGRPRLDIPLNTWKSGLLDDRKNYISWHQDPIFCARMGLTEEARKFTELKLSDSGRRFPAFWGPGHDWVPDHNWGGSGMIALQDMLVQYVDDKVYMFPAWPKEWNVDFKLHGPHGLVLQAALVNGVAEELSVMSQRKNEKIIMMLGVKE